MQDRLQQMHHYFVAPTPASTDCTGPQSFHFPSAPCACFLVAVVITGLMLLLLKLLQPARTYARQNSRALAPTVSRNFPHWMVNTRRPWLDNRALVPKETQDLSPKIYRSTSSRYTHGFWTALW